MTGKDVTLASIKSFNLACPPKTDPFAVLGFGSKT